MQTHKQHALALVAFVALATSACAGKDGIKGADGAAGTSGTDGTSGTSGTSGTDGTGVSSASTGLKIKVSGVTVNADNTVAVHFTAKDDRGYPVDLSGKTYSVNTAMQPRFALAYVSQDAAGNVLPYTVLSNSGSPAQPTAFNPLDTTKTGQGTVAENGTGAGDYTYAFPASVALDATKASNTHVVWVQATRQTNTTTADSSSFTAVNEEYDFIPAGSGTIVKREVASTAACNACHAGFKPEGGSLAIAASNAPFHGGGRIEAPFCDVCHNPGRTSNPAADASVFVHRIHNGKNIQTANQFHAIAASYPQDVRNCDACHKGAAQGAQAQTRPTRAACGSCHDAVDFTGVALNTCVKSSFNVTTGVTTAGTTMGGSGQCGHVGGIQTDDNSCAICHFPNKIASYHVPVVKPDPNNIYLVPGTGNNNTNAAFLAATGAVPTGAGQITYDVKSVSVNGSLNPVIVFKLKKNLTDVVFQTYAAGVTTELIPGFVGSPSVYFAWGQLEDGITAPADFNTTASGYIKNVWNGSAAGTTIVGPDANGYYTITLTSKTVPAGSTSLTGGVGYSYGLTATQPLTEIDLAAYPYNSTSKVGGLLVPAPDVWKVATGFTARRSIVSNAACNNCHGLLGVAPTFHAGQRNDGPTCAFCHNANQTNGGWSGNSKDFIHALHAGPARTNAFTWHATSATDNYGDVGFPSALNNCQACHFPGTYDFTATTVSGNSAKQTYTDALVANLLWSTDATGRFNKSPTTNPTGYYTLSPFVDQTNQTSYGYGFATSNVSYTLPDGISGTQGGIGCTPAAPCVCTAANPCTVTVGTAYAGPTYPGASNLSFKQGATTCTDGAPCTCTTNPASGPATNCSAVVATCSPAAPCASPASLVSSPITAACAACHDSPAALGHMKGNGGSFYVPRSAAFGAGPVEQCLLCHGPGTMAPIADVHR